MTDAKLQSVAENILYLEGYYLDTRKWDEWLDLFTEDVVYWVPSWKSEHEYTTDPESELCLIYYTNRNGLEDRVIRATSGQSPASTPLPRTVHLRSNVLVTAATGDRIGVHACWTTHSYRPKDKRNELLFGRCEYVLATTESGWKIAEKKTIIASELLPAVVDVYHL
jgi:3-phenylpropionate/cinnamic acid dioxygenase small subunit